MLLLLYLSAMKITVLGTETDIELCCVALEFLLPSILGVFGTVF